MTALAKTDAHNPSDSLNDVFPDYNLLTTSGYFKAVRRGVSGSEFKSIVNVISDRDTFAKVVGKDKSNLSKSYRLSKLPIALGDNVLDTTRIYMMAADIYGSLDLAKEWLSSPIPALGGEIPLEIMETAAGRELVKQTLNKINFGDYS